MHTTLHVLPSLLHFAISSGSRSWLPVKGSLFDCKHKAARPPRRSAAWTPRENLLLVATYFLRLSFLWSLLLPPVPGKGRRAESRSVKLVNHFLFSLRTAVDWRERPLCPPSPPASQRMCCFTPSGACLQRGGRRRGGEMTLITPTPARSRLPFDRAL